MAKKTKYGYSEPIQEDNYLKIRQLIKPQSDNQKLYIDTLSKTTITICIGPAGTGKTFLAVAQALKELLDGHVEKIIVTRPVISTDEALGFLPGEIEDKMAPYIRPIQDVVSELVGNRSMLKLFYDGKIEICPLAFMRGRSFKKSFVIGDEMSSATPNQFKNLLTRLGLGSKMVIVGDPSQSDLPRHSINGLSDFVTKCAAYNGSTGGLKLIRLNGSDLIRHPLLPMILDIYDGVSNVTPIEVAQ